MVRPQLAKLLFDAQNTIFVDWVILCIAWLAVPAVFHLLKCLEGADHAGRIIAGIISETLAPAVGLKFGLAAVVKLVQLKQCPTCLTDCVAAAQQGGKVY